MVRKARFAALTLAAALMIPQVALPTESSAAVTYPTLSIAQKTITAGKTFILNVNKNSTTKIVSTDWDVNDAGDDNVDLLNEKKKSVKIQGVKAGKAVVRAKIKYKVGRTVLTKKQKCKVTVKKKTVTPTAAPTTAPTTAPTATPAANVVPTFDGTTSSFVLNFTTPQACTVAQDSQDTTGKIWTNKATQVASVNWQGDDTYKLVITKVSLSNDGKQVRVFADPGKIRNGARFDVVLTGFYPTTATPGSTTTKYPMTDAVTGLVVAIDTNLTQPLFDNDGHANVVINFNQDVTNSQNYDTVLGGAYENGAWTTNASKVAKVYEVVNGTAKTTPLTIQGVHAYNKNNDKTKIGYINVDFGTNIGTSNTYRIDLTGFGSTTLSTTVVFKNETMIKTDAYYDLQNITKNGQSVNTILYFKVRNNNGRGQVLTAATTSGAGAPSTYATVLDGSNNTCKIAYIQSTKGSNQIEIGLAGNYNNAKYTVKFANSFPAVFLDLANDQLMNPGGDLVITQYGPTPVTPSGTGATYNSNIKAFEIVTPVAYDCMIAPDSVQNNVKIWTGSNADSLATFYNANKSTGYYDRNNPCVFDANEVRLDASGRRVTLYMNEDDLVNGNRYAICLNFFTNKASGAQISSDVYLATVTKKVTPNQLSILQGNTMGGVMSVGSAQGDYHTIIRVQFSGAYNNTVGTNLLSSNGYSGGWTGSAASSVCSVSSSSNIGISAVRKVANYNNVVEIELNGLYSSGTYKITMKGFYAANAAKTTASDLSFNYTMSNTTMYSARSTFGWIGDEICICLDIRPTLKATISDAEVTNIAKQYISVSGSLSERISINDAYIDSGKLFLMCDDVDNKVPYAFNVKCQGQVPYALCNLGDFVLCSVPSNISVSEQIIY